MYSILLVEDEAEIRNNLIELFEAEDFHVYSCRNGEEGVRMAIKHLPDIILSDIKMPVMDGFEFFHKLQESKLTKSIPFIYLSAKAEPFDFRRGMSLGADDYLIKPIDVNEILNAVHTRLKKKEEFTSVLEGVKDSIIKKVPHELRTPLVSILGYTELIKEDLEKLSFDEIKNLVMSIETSGKRLNRRVEKFLTYAEIVSSDGLAEATDKKFSLDSKSVFNDLINLVRECDRGSDLEVNIEECELDIDERYYKIIVKELAENALKHSIKGTPVRIVGRKKERYYTTSIIDHDRDLANISVSQINFFKQYGSQKGLTEEGGLGLSIVERVLNKAKGYIRAESAADNHTVVEFGIPI